MKDNFYSHPISCWSNFKLAEYFNTKIETNNEFKHIEVEKEILKRSANGEKIIL